jgi:hypothetical protein
VDNCSYDVIFHLGQPAVAACNFGPAGIYGTHTPVGRTGYAVCIQQPATHPTSASLLLQPII